MATRVGKHTILLIQHTNSFQTRHYMDFSTVGEAMDAVIQMYEHKLKELNPGIDHITYDISDLHAYVDSLQDLVALTLEPETRTYAPHDRVWVKSKVLLHLKDMARSH